MPVLFQLSKVMWRERKGRERGDSEGGERRKGRETNTGEQERGSNGRGWRGTESPLIDGDSPSIQNESIVNWRRFAVRKVTIITLMTGDLPFDNGQSPWKSPSKTIYSPLKYAELPYNIREFSAWIRKGAVNKTGSSRYKKGIDRNFTMSPVIENTGAPIITVNCHE